MSFELFVFTTDTYLAKEVLSAGASAVIVDWENQGKYQRQIGADTEINRDTPADLERLRKEVTGTLVCRINGFHEHTHDEVETAIQCGADEILLPMVRRVEDVERILEMVGGRCLTGILIETLAGVALAPQLGSLPLRRIYAGLNDLAIDSGASSIFQALVDGTLDRIRPHIKPAFGFGGLTVPEYGSPIPSALLRAEMVRLGATFTFLRRSFWRDVAGRDVALEIPRILAAMEESQQACEECKRRSRGEFIDAVESLRVSGA